MFLLTDRWNLTTLLPGWKMAPFGWMSERPQIVRDLLLGIRLFHPPPPHSLTRCLSIGPNERGMWCPRGTRLYGYRCHSPSHLGKAERGRERTTCKSLIDARTDLELRSRCFGRPTSQQHGDIGCLAGNGIIQCSPMQHIQHIFQFLCDIVCPHTIQ